MPRGILWSLVPFLTFGYGTPFSFLYAALRHRSASLGATSAGYGVILSATLVMPFMGDALFTAMSVIMMLMLWLGGTAHAFAVRPMVFPRTAPHSRRNEHAVKVAQYRRMLREEARTLAADDPALAHELRIGRPDLPRGYDDGGLIDVNHAPPQTLALLPGLSDELIERIVRHRDEHGGFISAEELAVDVDLSPSLVPQLAEYAVFLP
ncbi:ComEA family DNA-binding protein [Spirillospora sp. CA-255316]